MTMQLYSQPRLSTLQPAIAAVIMDIQCVLAPSLKLYDAEFPPLFLSESNQFYVHVYKCMYIMAINSIKLMMMYGDVKLKKGNVDQ